MQGWARRCCCGEDHSGGWGGVRGWPTLQGRVPTHAGRCVSHFFHGSKGGGGGPGHASRTHPLVAPTCVKEEWVGSWQAVCGSGWVYRARMGGRHVAHAQS